MLHERRLSAIANRSGLLFLGRAGGWPISGLTPEGVSVLAWFRPVPRLLVISRRGLPTVLSWRPCGLHRWGTTVDYPGR